MDAKTTQGTKLENRKETLLYLIFSRFLWLIFQLLASYIGEFQTHRQFPTLTEKFLFIPYISDKIDPKAHAQVVVSEIREYASNMTQLTRY